jgi:hypothetical protein
MSLGLVSWYKAYKSSKTYLFETLNSGYYNHSKFMNAVIGSHAILTAFVSDLSPTNMLKDVTDDFLDFVQEIINFYETLCCLVEFQSLSNGEIVPVELAFTNEGRYITTVWYDTSSEELTCLYYTPSSFGSKDMTFHVWGTDSRQSSITDPKVVRYSIPLAPTLGLRKTASSILTLLVKSFFSKRKCAHIDTQKGYYTGSEAYASFIASAKLGASLVLFDAEASSQCVDFFFGPEGFDTVASAKLASKASLQAISFLKGIDRETLKGLSLIAFYGKLPSLMACPDFDLDMTPIYGLYGHLNRQYTGFTHNGETAKSSIRFATSLVPSADGIPMFVLVAGETMKSKSIDSPSISGNFTSKDLDLTVQTPPLPVSRKR